MNSEGLKGSRITLDCQYSNISQLIIDEAGIERLEHLLWPLWFGIDNAGAQRYGDRAGPNHMTNERTMTTPAIKSMI